MNRPSLHKPAPASMRNRVALKFLAALDAVARGKATVEDWRMLSDCINTMETLRDQGKVLAAEINPTLNAAVAAMVRMHRRHDDGKPMVADGEGLKALRAIVAAYEDCLAGLSHFDMQDAQRRTQARLQEYWRTGKIRGAEVLAV